MVLHSQYEIKEVCGPRRGRRKKDKATVDPLDTEQWEFYVVPTSVSFGVDWAGTVRTSPVPTLEIWSPSGLPQEEEAFAAA